MAQEQEQDTLAPANNDEIEPLSDELLEDAAGGAVAQCSGSFCSHLEP